MSRRPRIPLAVSRQVLMEAGHRCAVCGTPCPLERAHIVPWHRTKDHRAENLICLCANCHERADKEEWQTATLQEYKRNPWVRRQFGAETESKGQKYEMVQVTINLSKAHFNETEELWIKHGVASFLNLAPSQVKIISVKEGSLRITLSLPEGSARELLARRGESLLVELLNPLQLVGVSDIHDPDIARLKRDDETEWAKAFRLLWPIALQRARATGLNPNDCEDIASESMARLAPAIVSVKTFDELKAYLSVITSRNSLSRLRHKLAAKRGGGPSLIDIEPLIVSPEEAILPVEHSQAIPEIEKTELVHLLLQLISTLDPTTRLLLREKLVHGCTFAEMSARFQIPQQTLISKITRGMSRLRRTLERDRELKAELKSYLE